MDGSLSLTEKNRTVRNLTENVYFIYVRIFKNRCDR